MNPCFMTLAVASHSNRRLMLTHTTSPAQRPQFILYLNTNEQHDELQSLSRLFPAFDSTWRH